MKKILFCNPLPLTKELGGSKVTVELAEALQDFGWECTLVGSNDVLAVGGGVTGPWHTVYSHALRNYLRQHSDKYDVVDYSHEYLPFPRAEFSRKPLFVARSVMLAHHLEMIPIPVASSWKSKLGRLVKGRGEQSKRRQIIHQATQTIEQADLVNVSNSDDKAELMRRGIPGEKIVIIPYGIGGERRSLFDAVPSDAPPQPKVAFVGTFDYRKGAKEFPAIVQRVTDAIPVARFRLLGAKGMYQTEQEILAHFPPALRARIEVVLAFPAHELPSLLSDCSIGIFPSHIEGFGFGVLEMLAASIPVIAYDAPGPPMMLPPEYLVPRGDAQRLSDKVIALLQNPSQLAAARAWAKQRSGQFSWEQAARMTDAAYRSRLHTPTSLSPGEGLLPCVS